MTFVYIVSQHKGNRTEYIVRSRLSPEEGCDDLDVGNRLGYSLFRMYRDIPNKCLRDVIETCSEFRIGKLTAESLDKKVKGILGGEEK